MPNLIDTRRMIPVNADTYESLLREKNKRSVEKGRKITWNELTRELLGMKK